MSIGHVKLSELIPVARRSPIEAMGLLPDGADVSTVGRGLPLVVAQSYSSAHRVLVEDESSYRKPWVIRQVIVDGLGQNLFTTEGDRWLARRKPVAPVFGLSNLDALASLMLATVEEVSASWQPGEIDIQQAMTDLTIRVALRGLLGVDEQTEELATEVRRTFEEILEWITYRFNSPMSPPLIAPTPRNRRHKQSRGELHDAIRALIEHRRSNDTESFDILGQLLAAQSENPELTDQAIVEECAGFMFAGHETTASTLTWALYELSLRPDLQTAIAEEGRRLEGPTDLVEALKDMSETEAVMAETLRMYPSGISIVRSAKRTTELAGRKIRRGTMVMIPVYSIQRSSETWANPNEFDPHRDLDPEAGGYLPFGLGPRRCLGARFARTELQIAISRICATWELSYEADTPPRQVVAPSLRAEGKLPLAINERT